MRVALKSVLVAVSVMLWAGVAVAQAPDPSIADPVVDAPTTEELNALQRLRTLLSAAQTPEARQQILADAIALTPTLASKPELSTAVQEAAVESGLSVSQFDTAVISGLASASAPSASGFPVVQGSGQ
ncbi:hypothetical protein [Pontivivens insulae]|uniref:Uncharacterized protein n=1 Tax=Pontivivens insulae TaxID=1639689 RepID=A0A2R8A861_9RHOB|nr:hypothetical protein [Pontivivens insulae]RED18322.1 hypothetical protein DFR53_0517 [Pontivivens insulae]SPF28220.1 hypothetical protein POI8812_00518 [Pontivivens insulae]